MTVSEANEVIANHYGFDEQSRMLQEECGELIQAVNKVHRKHNVVKTECRNTKALYDYRESIDALYEELADVEIMIEQIKMLMRCEADVAHIKWLKIQRQIERIDEEKRRKVGNK